MNKREEAMTFGIEEIQPQEAYVPRKNKSCFFILPLLGYPSYWYYGLMNCYLLDKINKPELGYKIFINTKSYDSRLLNIYEFITFYQLEDKSYMYAFNIPTKFQEDYDRFCEGRYSKISEEGKKLICKLSGIKPIIESVVYNVLYKTDMQRMKIEELIGEKLPLEAEVYSLPNLEKETFTMFNIKSSSIVKAIEREIE